MGDGEEDERASAVAVARRSLGECETPPGALDRDGESDRVIRGERITSTEADPPGMGGETERVARVTSPDDGEEDAGV